MIQAIVFSFVAMSGAGMSLGLDHGPQLDRVAAGHPLQLPSDISRGLQRMPPFAPP